MAATTKDDFQVWVDQNPLRVWRAETGWSIMRTATTLGVSMTIIQLWEKGVHVPSEDNLARLQRLMGDSAIRDWSNWYSSKPTI